MQGVSGSGKTTFGRRLAARLGVPFLELDALNHGPGWTEASPEEFRARVAPHAAGEAWVIDGAYRSKLGDLVLSRADTVVWLDLPLRTCLARMLGRTARRIRSGEELWAGNRESWREAVVGRDALLWWLIKEHRLTRLLLETGVDEQG